MGIELTLALEPDATLQDAKEQAAKAYLKKLIPQHTDLAGVAAQAGCTVHTVRNHMQRHGLQARKACLKLDSPDESAA